MVDIVSDTLSRIKNGLLVKKKKVNIQKSKLVVNLLRVLKQENMIYDFEVKENEIEVKLKYLNDDFEEPMIKHLERVSKPGQRIYIKSVDIVPVRNGRGIGIISTSQGLLSNAQAKARNIGGEYLCKIW